MIQLKCPNYFWPGLEIRINEPFDLHLRILIFYQLFKNSITITRDYSVIPRCKIEHMKQ